MALTLRDLWEATPGRRRRTLLALRAFGALLRVALLEWNDQLRGVSTPGHSPVGPPRRWGMASWIRNLRYALRTLRTWPSFTITAVVLVGLGVGAATTVFTLVDHVLLRPLPYPSAERLFLVENGSHSGPTAHEFEALESVEAWGFAFSRTANLLRKGDPLRVQQVQVSRDFFSVFGARPRVGRLFVEEDFGAANVAVLGHGLWMEAFGGDPAVVGRTLRIGDSPVTVVGVLSQAFLPPEPLSQRGEPPELWVPLDWSTEELTEVHFHVLEAMGRMAPGITLGDVEAELDRALERLTRRHPEQFLDDDGALQYDFPAAGLHEITTRPVRAGLGLLSGAVVLLLLVACVNVAHLFLARGLGRTREMAVRRALGADTWNLTQQLLMESLVLGICGGLLGLGLAVIGLETFLTLNPWALPRGSTVSLDLRVLLFAVLISMVAVLLFGLVPAIRSVGRDLALDLKGVSRSATHDRDTGRARGALVVAEVALSLVLVSAAGLLIKSFMDLQSRDPGFRSEAVWTLPLSPTGVSSPGEYVASMDRIRASLAAVPGVERAAYSFTMPFEITGRGRCCWSTGSVTVEGRTREGISLLLQPVTRTYFETLGIHLVAGGLWRPSEASLEPWPAVISERLALEVFGSAETALNREFRTRDQEIPLRVYGVAADVRHFGLDQDYPFFVYLPVEKLPFAIPMVHMAVRGPPEPPGGWTRMLREAVWSAAPHMPVPTVRSMEGWIQESTAGRRFDSVLFGSLGTVALLLAAAGLYGTLLYAVGQRRRELGIRLALGARKGQIQGSVVRKGLGLASLGSVLGLAGAWATGRFLESRLFDLEPTDPWTLATAAGVLLVAAGVASWVPARRAARTDPLETLKGD